MDDRVNVKKAFIEFAFWFISFTVLRLLLSFLITGFVTHAKLSAGERLTMGLKGSFATALIVTLLNRLLKRILERVK
jgi:hypothetical protein